MSELVQTEKVLQELIFNKLSLCFHVESEVWSSCRSRRIDLVAVHKSDVAYGYGIGIEVKKFDSKTGADIAKWLQQAADYSKLVWNTYGRIMVIVAPQMSGYVFEEGQLTDKGHLKDGRPTPHHNFSTFMGQFNIGELQTYTYTSYPDYRQHKRVRIVFKGSPIWDETYDVFNYDAYNRVCKR